MASALFTVFPRLLDRKVSLALRKEKELAPILVKLSLMVLSTLSIAVRIPTKQVMPTAMISSVKNDRKKLSFIDRKAIFMFSV